MFRGSIVALVTPMRANGDIDFSSLRQLVEWHIANKTDAIVATGTTGESPTLDFDEQIAIIQAITEQAATRVPVIAGTGSCSTAKTIKLTQKAMEVGVDACLLVTPYYNRPTQEGLYQHYRTVAEAVPIPQILYNVPSRTGCDLLPDTAIRLSVIPNIVGIKEGMPDRARTIIERCGTSLDVFSGDDATALEIMQRGGKGVISVTANVAPKAMHEMCEAALAGNIELASQIDQTLTGLHKHLFVETNPIPVKWALQELGHIPAGLRLPLTSLSEQHHQIIRAALEQAGVK